MAQRFIKILLFGLGILIVIFLVFANLINLDGGERTVKTSQQSEFSGARAFTDVAYQVSLGPRTPGSRAHAEVFNWIYSELGDAGWEAEIQDLTIKDKEIHNVIGKWGDGDLWIIVGAHYDSRLVADHDPEVENRQTPVPGANDGASGVAVLLEIARTLPGYIYRQNDNNSSKIGEIWLVFFDAEDNGRISDWDWIMGSQAFVSSLEDRPDAVVIIDMIGDADLNIYIENSSSPELVNEIWTEAANIGFGEYFIDQKKYTILDDHTPFINAGIPAVDIIDFDYPYYHTLDDTTDKVSEMSLEIVGRTVISWLLNRAP